jgi:DNA-binding HxlR family transcriptional regulator
MDTLTRVSPAVVHSPEDCPVETTLRVIGGRWKAVIIYHLRGGPRRFNELRRMLPNVTQRMLIQHLRELQADGILDRRVFEVVPPHVEYSISVAGRTPLPILDAMAAWGQEQLAEGAAT